MMFRINDGPLRHQPADDDLVALARLGAALRGYAAWRRGASRKKELPKATLSNTPGQVARP